MVTLTDEEATNIGLQSQAMGVSQTIGGYGTFRAIPWMEGTWQGNASPACWNWALNGGNGAPNDDPLHGYAARGGGQRPNTGCWAANDATSTGVLNGLPALPVGCVAHAQGIAVRNDVTGAYSTWFNNIVSALTRRQAEYAGFTVSAVAVDNLNNLGGLDLGQYYLFMIPEYGPVNNAQNVPASSAVYYAPMYDHWWLQVPAGNGHYVTIDTVTGNPLRLHYDSRPWNGANARVVKCTVNGIPDIVKNMLEMLGALS